MHKLVTRAQKLAKAKEMKNNYLVRARPLKPKKYEPSHPNQPQQKEKPSSRPESPKQ